MIRSRAVSLLAAALLLAPPAAFANPVNGQVVGGSASIQGQGTKTVTVTQGSQNAIINWYNFNIPGRLDASIVNLGNITASSGGFAALVAPGVRNAGTITANLGHVALA